MRIIFVRFISRHEYLLFNSHVATIKVRDLYVSHDSYDKHVQITIKM